MDFWAAIVNGLGFVLGASIGGFAVGLILKAKPNANDKATEALLRRNEIGERQATAMESIASALHLIELKTKDALK